MKNIKNNPGVRIKCSQCGKKVFDAYHNRGFIEIRCRSCNRLNLRVDISRPKMPKPQKVEVVNPPKKTVEKPKEAAQ